MSEREPLGDEESVEASSPGSAVPPPEHETDSETETGTETGTETDVDPDVEVVDGFPVLAEVRTVERVSPASLPAVQAAAAAATGFVAGAATVVLVKRRAARKTARNGKGGSRRAVDLLPIVGSRSFLVDVHVIGKQGD
ncbi:MAG TPA: hypothetical protein VMA77_26880 [Solirubrobacteraceae bacterium]|nr:hypothetical protein [Solirubrobacteraceae bacterium]